MARRVHNGRAALVAAVPTPPSARGVRTGSRVDPNECGLRRWWGRASRAPVRPYASGPTAGRPAPRAGRRGRRPLPQIPTKDSDHRFRPQVPTTGSDHRFRPQIPTTDPGHRFRPQIPATGSGHRFRPQIPATDSDHRSRPQIPTAVPDRPPVCCVIRPRSRNKSRPSRCVPFRSEIARRHAGGPRLSRPYPRRARSRANVDARHPLAERLLK